ncbi:HPr family phosphocarrier protein [Bacillus solitudinis]|uniref:HPr family phosphocarrier protein n=1 Tax=Bacillus solitudinis TaxID=2014074 RepID=UPI000C23D3BE|nr:HPr family phosphocarrier protein [Bacillus solitudinis]
MRVKVLKPVFAETASNLVNVTSKYPETILIKKQHWVIDAKSLLGLLALSLQPDQEVDIEVQDSDSTEPLEDILNTGLFEKI